MYRQIEAKVIRPTKAMYKHLISFTCRTGATNTHTKAQRKEEPPLLRPVNRLRHSPCPLSQVHLRPPAAPSVRVSHQQAAPGHERGNERGGRERELASRINRQKEREHMGGEAKREREIQEEAPRGRAKHEEGTPRTCPSFMERGSALRSAPFRAPPPFWKLPKKGAFPTPGSVTPRVHQSGASRPTPPPSHSSEKTGRQNPRASRNSCSFLSRSALVIVVVGGRWV